MDRLYLIKEGEISLKGGNRNLFEKRLRQNIKDKIRPYHSEIDRQKGRLYAYISEEAPEELVDKALRTTPGVVGYARAYRTEKSMDAIIRTALEILPASSFRDSGTFRITVKREDKGFPLNSHQIAIELAKAVAEVFPKLEVDLDSPDYTLCCEIRGEAYLYTDQIRCEGGLPAGTAGRGMLLLSGGIDSPVAGYMMAKRGMRCDAIYFHAYPYTSNEALEKVKTLASLIAPYNQGMRLFVVPFTEGQVHIRDNGYEEEATLMFRAAMMQTAQRIAKANEAIAIVTGEALSQVASQTLDAMSFTDSMTDLLVIRPLVGMDKEDIIGKAKRIGTYDTSILPYEDCCVVFSPKHPVTRPVKEVSRRHYEELSMESFIEEAVAGTQVFSFDSMGRETDA